MRVIGKVAIGGTVASVATAGWLVAAGVFATSATMVAVDPIAPPARAEGLIASNSCDTLLDWYVERGVRDVTAYGWNYPVFFSRVVDLRMPLAMMTKAVTGTLDAGSALQRSSSATGTNTQEAAVDESDVAKTDGSLVARIVGDRRLVLVDVGHGKPTVTRRLRLPKDGYGSELLLLGNRVLITQTGYERNRHPHGTPSGSLSKSYRAGTSSRLLDVDISDPKAPRLLSTTEYSGQILSLRQYGDTVRMVTSTGRPELKWVYPHKGVSKSDALTRNRALVRRTTLADWVPEVGSPTNAKPLAACDQIFHPGAWSGGSTVALTSFDIHAPDQLNTVAVTADSQLVYSSADRLYLAATESDTGRRLGLGGDLRAPDTRPRTPRTDLYAFGLDGLSTPYLGTGAVNGWVRDRWSLDEYGGKLRVAWTKTGRRGVNQSGISVFTESNGRLARTGVVGGLGKNEDLQAVRWFDNLAIVVTYRQVDPLYTIDLTDPAHPTKLGALKLPGYSGYLHPIGKDRLLGLGMDETGSVGHSQAAVFDIADLTHPRPISKHAFGGDNGLAVLDDPRSFTWLADSRTAVTSVVDWTNNHATLYALQVGPAGYLHVRALADLNQDWQARTLPLPDGRVAILDSHRLRVVKVG